MRMLLLNKRNRKYACLSYSHVFMVIRSQFENSLLCWNSVRLAALEACWVTFNLTVLVGCCSHTFAFCILSNNNISVRWHWFCVCMFTSFDVCICENDVNFMRLISNEYFRWNGPEKLCLSWKLCFLNISRVREANIISNYSIEYHKTYLPNLFNNSVSTF